MVNVKRQSKQENLEHHRQRKQPGWKYKEACVVKISRKMRLMGVQLALYIHGFCMHGFKQLKLKIIEKKFQKLPKAKLEFALYWPLFTWHLHCIKYDSNVEMI